MSPKTVYLISGANRGIGFELTTILASRPDTVVYAGTRDPSKSAALDALAHQRPGAVRIVKLTSGSVEDNQAAAAAIEQAEGHLDVVIANAGISNYYGPVATTPVEQFRDHWEVNTLGPIVLFQAVHALLTKSPAPYFGVVSSAAGSIGQYFHMSAGAYGSSKAAIDFIVRVLHAENENMTITALHPGWVATDMGNTGAAANGMPQAPVSVQDSAQGLLTHIDGATRETKGGRFWNFKVETDGLPWQIATDEVVW